MEREGISKCCTIKVKINSPTTSTEAMPAIDSGSVSLGRGGFSFFVRIFSNIAKYFFPENEISAPGETCGSSASGQRNEQSCETGSSSAPLRPFADTDLWA